MTIEDTVIDVISRVSGTNAANIHPSTGLSEIEMDSLDRIECVLTLEEALRVEIAENDLWNLRTVRDVIEAVERFKAAQA